MLTINVRLKSWNGHNLFVIGPKKRFGKEHGPLTSEELRVVEWSWTKDTKWEMNSVPFTPSFFKMNKKSHDLLRHLNSTFTPIVITTDA